MESIILVGRVDRLFLFGVCVCVCMWTRNRGDSVSLFALLNSESVPCYCIYYAFGHKSGHGRRGAFFKTLQKSTVRNLYNTLNVT